MNYTDAMIYQLRHEMADVFNRLTALENGMRRDAKQDTTSVAAIQRQEQVKLDQQAIWEKRSVNFFRVLLPSGGKNIQARSRMIAGGS